MQNYVTVKSKNILKVIRNFESVLHMASKEENLDMSLSTIHRNLECGTVCCHAGWYAVATVEYISQDGRPQSYFDGVNQMAKDLELPECAGFPVLRWAKENPDLWGNKEGDRMFAADGSGFNPAPKTLQDIVDHWKGVYERVKATEQSEYEDITEKLAILPIEEKPDLLTIKTKEYAS